ncbi:hypothetical protein AB0M87_04510 [Streptomyces sp. NPDC051320]|uniref:hypothetical protein n=1 Tax=Streptomyces sp. NPDC051320 TaxID=3154644 RepID=UPI0034366581
MSLEDHTKSNNKYESQKAAAKAILDAVTAQVDVVTAAGGGPDMIGPRLKRLAEVYALVVHGKPDA